MKKRRDGTEKRKNLIEDSGKNNRNEPYILLLLSAFTVANEVGLSIATFDELSSLLIIIPL